MQQIFNLTLAILFAVIALPCFSAMYEGDMLLPIKKMSRPGVDLHFPAQYYDGETGLHYNWHRYFDPKLGRYLQADPIRLQGGENMYAYVGNDPLNAIDPLGLDLQANGIDVNDPNYVLTRYMNNPSHTPDSYFEGAFAVGFHGPATKYGPSYEVAPCRSGCVDVGFDKLVSFIKEKGWKQGQPIVLFICNAGRWGDKSIAQRLANTFNTKVIAPDRLLRVWGKNIIDSEGSKRAHITGWMVSEDVEPCPECENGFRPVDQGRWHEFYYKEGYVPFVEKNFIDHFVELID